jgi:TRAP-type mannitol/chloroaromatic compound transport system permease small subunit
MKRLLTLARTVDAINQAVGQLCLWLIFAAVLISAGNAVARYGSNVSSNAWLEVQWYLFSAVFLGAAGYTLKHNAHVRIDLVSGRFSKRAHAWIDLFGALFMLLPVCLIMLWYGWSAAMESYRVLEMSSDAGGLARWPIKFLVPAAFLLLILQGASETIKRIAYLRGLTGDEAEPGGKAMLEVPAHADRDAPR